MKQTYDGFCHCRSVQFRATLNLAEAIVCDCSICTKKGAIMIRIEESDFELLSRLGDVGVYSFHTHTAKHYFCRTCGIHTFHRPRTYPERWGVNIRCLDGVDVNAIEPRRVFGSKLD